MLRSPIKFAQLFRVTPEPNRKRERGMDGCGTFTDQKFTARASGIGGVPFPVIYGLSLARRSGE